MPKDREQRTDEAEASSSTPPRSCAASCTSRLPASATPSASRRLSWLDSVKLLAPEQPPVREDLACHPWFRILDRAVRQAQDREAAAKARCMPMRDAIWRQARSRLPCWGPALYRPHATSGPLGMLCLNALVLDFTQQLGLAAVFW